MNTPRYTQGAGNVPDTTMRTSPFNRDFVSRVEEALINKQVSESVEQAVAMKSGRWQQTHEVKGINPADTDLIKRIEAASHNPDNSAEYRMAKRQNEILKWQNDRLKEDKARNIKYAQDMKSWLS